MSFQEKADWFYSINEAKNLENNFLDSTNKMSLNKINDYFNDEKNQDFIKKDLVWSNKDKILNSDFYKNTIDKKYWIWTDDIQARLKEVWDEINNFMKKNRIENKVFSEIFNISSDWVFWKNTLKALIVFQKVMWLETNWLVNMYSVGLLFPEKFGTNKKLYSFDISRSRRRTTEIVNNEIKNKFINYLEKIDSTKRITKKEVSNLRKEVEKTNKKVETKKVKNTITEYKFFKENSENIPWINYKSLIDNLKSIWYPLESYYWEWYRTDVFNAILNLQKSFWLALTWMPDYNTLWLIFPNYFKTKNKNDYWKSVYEIKKYIKKKVWIYNEWWEDKNLDLQWKVDLVKSKKLADFAERNWARTRTNLCWKWVWDTLLKYWIDWLPTSWRHWYKWEDFLDNNSNFEKVRLNHISEAKPWAILVYDKWYWLTYARRKYGHVEIKINDNKYFYWMFDSYPGWSVNANNQKSWFTWYAYYLR